MASGLKKSPAKFLMAAAGIASGAVKIFGGMAAKRRAGREQAKAQKELNKQKQAFKALDTSNLYADVKNPYANISMENVYEDLTVNQQQAQFQAQEQAQQRADVMQNLRGAAGGSGIAALAQTMAREQAIGTQKISASIGEQEAAQQQLKAKGAADVLAREQLKAKGGYAAEQARIGGAEASRGLEYKKTQAMMGMAAGQLSAANQAKAAAQRQITSGIGSAIGGVASGAVSGLSNIGKGLKFFGGAKDAIGGIAETGAGLAGSLPGADAVGSLTGGLIGEGNTLNNLVGAGNIGQFGTPSQMLGLSGVGSNLYQPNLGVNLNLPQTPDLSWQAMTGNR